jgi:Uma2 family endonuclease
MATRITIMATQPRLYLTPQQYLEIDRAAERGSEYYDGEMFSIEAMSLVHDRIFRNILRSLDAQLRGRSCEPAGSNLRVKCGPSGPYFYPDIVVFCGAPMLEDSHEDTLLDVTVIIEILSPSTERYDRSFKFEHYRRLPSLEHYLLIAQNEVKIEHRRRLPDSSWTAVVSSDQQAVVELSAIGCGLSIGSIYENAQFRAR